MTFTTFTTNCTLPPTTTSFTTSPNTRGTLDILWQCLTTLFLCTWSVQHPNVPALQTDVSWVKHRLRWLAKKLRMMFVTLTAPEWLLLKTIGDRRVARRLRVQYEGVAGEDGVEWGEVHGFFAGMGGFVVDFGEDGVKDEVEGISGGGSVDSQSLPVYDEEQAMGMEITASINPDQERQDSEEGLKSATKTEIITTKTTNSKIAQQSPTKHQTKLQAFIQFFEKRLPPSKHPNTALVKATLADLKQTITTKKDVQTTESLNNTVTNIIRLRGRYWALDGAQLHHARTMGIIAKLPSMKAEAIDEKSSTDALAKLLAVLQTAEQVGRILKRLIQKDPSSQLEIVTVAYCIITFFTYIICWNKPQEIERPRLIPAARYATKQEMLRIADAGPAYTAGVFSGFGYAMPEHTMHSHLHPTDTEIAGGVSGWWGAIMGGVVLGLVHCAAWNVQFPTSIERLLWRVASVVTSVMPLGYGLRSIPAVMRMEQPRRVPYVVGVVVKPVVMGVAGLYTVSRVFLLVETFRGLAFLSPDTYKS